MILRRVRKSDRRIPAPKSRKCIVGWTEVERKELQLNFSAVRFRGYGKRPGIIRHRRSVWERLGVQHASRAEIVWSRADLVGNAQPAIRGVSWGGAVAPDRTFWKCANRRVCDLCTVPSEGWTIQDVYAAVAPCGLGFAGAGVDSGRDVAVSAGTSLGVRTAVLRCGSIAVHCAEAHDGCIGVERRLVRGLLPAHGMRLGARWQRLPAARGSRGRAVRARAARGTPGDAAWKWEGNVFLAAPDVPVPKARRTRRRGRRYSSPGSH